jgi:hypothetical protein
MDICVNEEIFVDYCTEYWSQKPTVGIEENEEKK